MYVCGGGHDASQTWNTRLAGIMPVVGSAPVEFEKQTCRHAVKLSPAVQCLVKEAARTVGHVVSSLLLG